MLAEAAGNAQTWPMMFVGRGLKVLLLTIQRSHPIGDLRTR
jgi:hypothetical protein